MVFLQVLACACSSLSGPFQATRKLNADLARGPAGTVSDFRLSADSTRAVYIADEHTDGVPELYVAPLDGSQAPLRLSGTVAGITGLEIAPDDAWVAFLADQESSLVTEVYSVPIDGSQAPVRLNADLPSSGEVSEARISADASRVVYRADQELDDRLELYSVPIDGSGAPVKLSGTLVTGGDVGRFRISPDGARVLYEADQEVDGRFELYSAPIDGGSAAVNLSGFSAGTTLYPSFDFEVSADSSRVVYIAQAGNLPPPDYFRLELYSAPLDGSAAPVKLSGSLVSGGDVESFRIGPDGTRVVYWADQELDGQTELYSAPTDGSSAATKLNGSLVDATTDVESDAGFTPDGTRVLYRAREDTLQVELYSVGAGGSPSSVRLSDVAVSACVDVTSFRISPDGATVAYVADQEVSCRFELYGAPTAGGTAQKLSGSLVSGGDVLDGVRFTPDLRVVYLADQELDERFDLYSVPSDGSAAPAKLDGPLGQDRDVTQFLVGATRVAFLADIEGDEVFGLHSAPSEGSAAPVRVSGSPIQIVGDVVDFELSPDGRFVVYQGPHAPSGIGGFGRAELLGQAAPTILQVDSTFLQFPFAFTPDSARLVFLTDSATAGKNELFSVPADWSAAPVKLNGTLSDFEDVVDFRLSPDGARAVYLAPESPGDMDELYSIPPDGQGARIQLTPLASGRDVLASYQISPDASRAVYVADQDTNDAFELYSVPILGGATVKLHVSLGPSRDVSAFRIGPDSQRVVFLADRDTDEVSELYSAPIDGSAPELELNAALPTGGEVGGLFLTLGVTISPDSSRVVYTADQEVNDRTELFSVPIDGSAAPVKLNASLTAQGDVFDIDILVSPDSTRVVYRADQALDEVFEYFSVPVDGSAAPVRLNDPLGGNRDVLAGGAISPEGGWFVFLADRDANKMFELYSVPLAGGATHELNLPLPPGGDVLGFRISPDGREVAYQADQVQDEVVELFLVPIDGSRPARKESSPMVLRGDVSPYPPAFLFTRNGNGLVYRADQVLDGVVELFLATLRPRTWRTR
jgi:Tol biopolymer transport system component